MDISVRFACGTLATIVVSDGNATIESDVADVHGIVDAQLIDDLRNLADELESFNESNKK